MVSEDLKEYVKKELQKHYPHAKIDFHKKTLPNGEVLTGVYIQETNTGATACMYLDNYNKNANKNEVIKDLIKQHEYYKKSAFANLSTVAIDSWDDAKQNIRLRLYPKAFQSEFSKPAKKYGFEGLIIVPYVDIDMPGQKGSAQITENLLEQWNVGLGDVFDEGFKNMKRLCEIQPASQGYMALTINEDDGMYGAIAAVVCRDSLKTMFPRGYVIIPLSIHQCLLMTIPKDYQKGDEDVLTKMLNGYNEKHPEEKLADHVYVFLPEK